MNRIFALLLFGVMSSFLSLAFAGFDGERLNRLEKAFAEAPANDQKVLARFELEMLQMGREIFNPYSHSLADRSDKRRFLELLHQFVNKYPVKYSTQIGQLKSRYQALPSLSNQFATARSDFDQEVHKFLNEQIASKENERVSESSFLSVEKYLTHFRLYIHQVEELKAFSKNRSSLSAKENDQAQTLLESLRSLESEIIEIEATADLEIHHHHPEQQTEFEKAKSQFHRVSVPSLKLLRKKVDRILTQANFSSSEIKKEEEEKKASVQKIRFTEELRSKESNPSDQRDNTELVEESFVPHPKKNLRAVQKPTCDSSQLGSCPSIRELTAITPATKGNSAVASFLPSSAASVPVSGDSKSRLQVRGSQSDLDWSEVGVGRKNRKKKGKERSVGVGLALSPELIAHEFMNVSKNSADKKVDAGNEGSEIEVQSSRKQEVDAEEGKTEEKTIDTQSKIGSQTKIGRKKKKKKENSRPSQRKPSGDMSLEELDSFIMASIQEVPAQKKQDFPEEVKRLSLQLREAGSFLQALIQAERLLDSLSAQELKLRTNRELKLHLLYLMSQHHPDSAEKLRFLSKAALMAKTEVLGDEAIEALIDYVRLLPSEIEDFTTQGFMNMNQIYARLNFLIKNSTADSRTKSNWSYDISGILSRKNDDRNSMTAYSFAVAHENLRDREAMDLLIDDPKTQLTEKIVDLRSHPKKFTENMSLFQKYRGIEELIRRFPYGTQDDENHSIRTLALELIQSTETLSFPGYFHHLFRFTGLNALAKLDRDFKSYQKAYSAYAEFDFFYERIPIIDRQPLVDPNAPKGTKPTPSFFVGTYDQAKYSFLINFAHVKHHRGHALAAKEILQDMEPLAARLELELPHIAFPSIEGANDFQLGLPLLESEIFKTLNVFMRSPNLSSKKLVTLVDSLLGKSFYSPETVRYKLLQCVLLEALSNYCTRNGDCASDENSATEIRNYRLEMVNIAEGLYESTKKFNRKEDIEIILRVQVTGLMALFNSSTDKIERTQYFEKLKWIQGLYDRQKMDSYIQWNESGLEASMKRCFPSAKASDPKPQEA